MQFPIFESLSLEEFAPLLVVISIKVWSKNVEIVFSLKDNNICPW